MLRWPEKFKAAAASAMSLVSQIDLYPSLCEWLDLEKPAKLQGKSLLPIIADTTAEINEVIFSEVTYHAGNESAAACAVRIFSTFLPLGSPAAAGGGHY